MTEIYYLAPDSERPSWGLGIIYNHVSMLNQNGFNASIIKSGKLEVPKWLDVNVPVRDVDYLLRQSGKDDVLVVPEVMMDFNHLKKLECRKILFIQASGYLFESMPKGENHRSLGFEFVFIIMPHMKAIVEKHIQLPYTIIPPYVDRIFFSKPRTRRKKKILMYPKFQQIDFSVVKYLLSRFLQRRRTHWLKNLVGGTNWEIKEIKGMTHREVAEEMRSATFLISLNVFEALNTSVAEAMAAGCVVFCYEGFGPRDYLKNNQNAFVFGNNEAYALAESVMDCIAHFEEKENQINAVREQACLTAEGFKREITEEHLIEFFRDF